MQEYFAKQKKLDELIQTKVLRIVDDLIQLNVGNTTNDLRRATLRLIRENKVPEVIADRVKHEIEYFISNIKIPAQ
ncbi:hypothetical protein RKS58_02440 [Lysinibacillus capsici]|uniref:hypothetical protein n=1 Tax=Lysinibacillus capsici TaxID=2115968 RepID=UPI0028BF1C7C|nr:hypothetical protein [Lysinibacillus capsici]WNN76708.1 hypothetical protein RKS58_02440 [Lysinibacillus capsici]